MTDKQIDGSFAPLTRELEPSTDALWDHPLNEHNHEFGAASMTEQLLKDSHERH